MGEDAGGSGYTNYQALDRFKRDALESARTTDDYIKRLSLRAVPEMHGESVFLIEFPDFFLAHVEESLGTKVLVADEWRKLTGESCYHLVAQDTFAMIMNDMATSGASPVSVTMFLAVGDAGYLKDNLRRKTLVEGWRRCCERVGCVWAGGETPELTSVVLPNAAVLAGSAVGIIKPKERRIVERIKPGDVIVFLTSSGIHANGLTKARKIAEKLPGEFLATLPDGRPYGRALLEPTHLYGPFVERCLEGRIIIRYAAHITGHGWPKIMRAPKSFRYVIDTLPPPLPIFEFMVEKGDIPLKKAYATLNMGVGLALIVHESEVRDVVTIAAEHRKECGFDAIVGGHVEESTEKRLVIDPLGFEYDASDLDIR